MKILKYAAFVLACGLLMGTLVGYGKKDQANTSAQEAETLPQEEETQEAETFSREEETQEAETLSQEKEIPMASRIRVWGPVLEIGADSVTIDNRSESGSRGEMVLMIDPETTLLLDGEDGDPEELSELEKGDPVFAYIEQVMTLSLPPMVPTSVVFCDIPDDLRVPEYVQVTEMEQQTDGSCLMTADSNMQYMVPENCVISPYLTRNIVTLADVQTGSVCLVWSNEKLKAEKILLLPS